MVWEYTRAVLMLASLLVLALLGFRQLGPPTPVPSTAPPGEFSSARALQHLYQLAREPHPIGSTANAEVRRYLIGRLEKLGTEPEVQATFVSHIVNGRRYEGTPLNVLVKLEGTNSTGTILMSAHYDSVPRSPGAADNGAGVAALLETIRALNASAPLMNDVVFLFDDGEEAILLGARAFVEGHRWADEVTLAVNLDARGSSGPSWMFRTSNASPWLIGEFARGAPVAAASFITQSLFDLAPNVFTNLDVYQDAGISGLDFAFGGGPGYYHTRLDTTENLDEGSLQHHGSYALASARHFGNLDLVSPPGRDVAYFTILGSIVLYPTAWAWPVLLGALLLVGLVVGVGLSRGNLTLSGSTVGLLVLAASGTATTLLVAISYYLLHSLGGEAVENHLGVPWNSGAYALSFTSLAISVTTSVYAFLRGKVALPDLTLGALLWWITLAVLTSLSLPSNSYLVVWPAIFVLLGLASSILPGQAQTGAVGLLALLLPAFSGMLILVPALYALFILAPVAAPQLAYPVASLAVVLLLGLLVPHLALMAPSGHGKWALPALAGVLGVALLVTGSTLTPEDQGGISIR